jgi:hypothetical protein
VNHYSHPVWLGEFFQGTGTVDDDALVPPGGDWEIGPHGTVVLCMPAGWSGRFWGRTECNFEAYFGHDPGYGPCTSATDCTGAGHFCVGGRCLLDCSSGSTPLCQGATGLNNAIAICVKGPVDFCSYPNNTVCQTGTCVGAQCVIGCNDPSDQCALASPPVDLQCTVAVPGDTATYGEMYSAKVPFRLASR